jgi:hypothetical protein
MIYNTVANEAYDGEKGILLVPCYYNRRYVEWKPREAGGGYVGSYGADDPIINTTYRDQRGNAGRQDGKQPDAPKGKGDSTRDRGDGERPDACRRARRAFALAPLTLRPNQRPDRDGTDEIQEGWVKEQCSLHASRTGLCSGAIHKAPMMRAY